MLTDMREGAIGLLRGIREDVSRQSVLLTWGALLLVVYLTGWWHYAFERTAILVTVTLFVTSPRARGLMVGLGLAALLAAYLHHRVPVEVDTAAKAIGAELHGAAGPR